MHISHLAEETPSTANDYPITFMHLPPHLMHIILTIMSNLILVINAHEHNPPPWDTPHPKHLMPVTPVPTLLILPLLSIAQLPQYTPKPRTRLHPPHKTAAKHTFFPNRNVASLSTVASPNFNNYCLPTHSVALSP